jgi:hypothetical protein
VRAIKTSTISILAIGLVAGSALGVAAQDEEAAAEPSTPAKVAGTIEGGGDVVQEPTETVVDGLLEVRDFVLVGDALEMDDPRMTGSISVTFNADVHKVSDFEDVVLQTVELRIDNDDGSWTGQGTQLNHDGAGISEEEVINLLTLPMTGSGAYEGLSAYLFFDFSGDPPTVEGAIYEGELPPFPELPAPETEAAE